MREATADAPAPRWPSAGRGRRRRGPTVSLVMALVALLAGGCATQAAGVPGDLARAASSAASAAATGQLAMDLLLSGLSTATVTDTTLLDSLGESQDAEVAVASVVVDKPVEQVARTQTLDAIRAGTSALVRARAWVSGAQPRAAGDEIAAALGESADQLTALADAGPHP